MAITGKQPGQHAALPDQLVPQAGIGGIIEIQARHLVETDHPVDPQLFEALLQLGMKSPVAVMIGQTMHRQHVNMKTGRLLPLPAECEDMDFVSPLATDLGDPQHVSLEPTKRKILEQHEGEFHDLSPICSCNARQTLSGGKEAKQGGITSPRRLHRLFMQGAQE